MVRLLAEWSDTKSNVKLGGFQSQLQASYVSSQTEELGYKETVCLWMIIYIYIYIYISRKENAFSSSKGIVIKNKFEQNVTRSELNSVFLLYWLSY